MTEGAYQWGLFKYTKAVYLPVHDGWKALYCLSRGRPLVTVKDEEGSVILYPSADEANKAAWRKRKEEDNE
jgi:hypothetical protein